jgi:hypothetical protein
VAVRKQKVNFISAIPGLGKTRWAIRDMVAGLRRHGRSFYVAPTIQLLEQVYEELEQLLTAEELKLVFMIHSGSTGRVMDHVEACIRGGKCEGIKYQPAKPGTTILLSHNAFLQLKVDPVYDEFNVYFDEARKVVTQGRPVSLKTSEEQHLFRSLFELDDRQEKSGFRRVHCVSGAETILRENGAFTKTSNLPRQFKKIVQLFKLASNPRYEVFLRFPRNADAHEKSGGDYLMRSYDFYEIVVPSKLFLGFKNVTVIAAHFEDSQMYHLLKNDDNIKLVSSRHLLGPEQNKRFRILQSRYQSVVIVPLTPQFKCLSKHQLEDQILAPDLKVDSILGKIHTVTGVRRCLKQQKMNTGYKFDPEVLKAITYLNKVKEVELDPLSWYIRAARRVINSWKKKYPVAGAPLVVLNHDLAKLKRYTELLKSRTTGLPTMEILSMMNHGLNCYQDRNVMAFLASVNPPPQMIEFFTDQIPGYDFSKDHVADVCIQSVCRLSIRDTQASEPVLAIVPDLAIAQLLNEKMYSLARVYSKWALKKSMVMVNTDMINRYGHGEALARRKAKEENLKESLVERRCNSIAVQLNRERKKTINAGVRLKISQLEKERTMLRTLQKSPVDISEEDILNRARAISLKEK